MNLKLSLSDIEELGSKNPEEMSTLELAVMLDSVRNYLAELSESGSGESVLDLDNSEGYFISTSISGDDLLLSAKHYTKDVSVYGPSSIGSNYHQNRVITGLPTSLKKYMLIKAYNHPEL